MRTPLLAILLLAAAAEPVATQTPADWLAVFQVDRKALGVAGSNPYFNLTPG
jgi:hypothetical protein